MTTSLHLICTTVFNQSLGALGAILTKAQAHATARKIDPDALLHARLYPDMFALMRQVQIACDFAKGVSARLAGVEVPVFEDGEKTFADLQARVARTLAFIATLTPQQFEGSEMREIVTQAGSPREKRFLGQSYLLNYGLPQFYFHVTTAYALLRHNGVELGKKDFIGSY
ncbi:MAG: DUF1993 family protein [Burkholderiaceae bacterium]|nr:DUF1993 family protein [Burkholderiaceae bacterium]